MSTYTQILYHIVFGTKNHIGSLDMDRHAELCRYIAGLIKNKDSVPYLVGGYTEHLHILTTLHPSMSLADFVKDIKLATSQWIKQKQIFPDFGGWQNGYGAFTCSWPDKDRVIGYIQKQYEHHRHKPFREEFIKMLQRAGINFDERYLL